jgi:hypothetical protein
MKWPSRGAFEAASCEGKEAFTSGALAHRVAQRRLRARRDRHNRRLVPYHCRVCGLVHLGGGPRAAAKSYS